VDQIKLFKRIGELLGYLEAKSKSEETISVQYDKKQKVITYSKAAEKLYYYYVSPLELLYIRDFLIEDIADTIISTWNGLKRREDYEMS
jgi:hypothetical protein